jgi:hypothetical protein
MKKVVFAVLVFFVVFMLVVLPLTLRSIGTAEHYKIGADYIPSIKSVVGERKLSGAESSLVPLKKSYHYTSVENPKLDIEEYCEYLTNSEEFILLDSRGDNQRKLVKNSTKEGNVIVISISIRGQGYLITLEGGKGTVPSQ